MRVRVQASGFFRLGVAAALGLALLLAGCASSAPRTAQSSPPASPEEGWGRCHRSQLVNITFLCYQR